MSSSTHQRQRQRRFCYFYITASQCEPIEQPYLGNALIKNLFFKLTRPFRPWIDPRGANMIPIHIMLFNQPGTRLSIYSPIVYGEPKLVTERRFMLPLSDVITEIGVYKDIIEGYLSTMGVRRNMHPNAIGKIHDVIQVANPGFPIDVTIYDVTVDVLGKSEVVPPTISVFHIVEQVGLDSLEATIRQKPCAICRESLDHVYDAEEGIIRLPCLHLFHADCLIQCLNDHVHVCPLCNYPLPTVELGEPSKPSGQLDWRVLLVMSACGIINNC
ncbi:uncharacterized protein LOC133734323 [Rosa rugosa]|uniref:uncharacterized protein LOC133734323 n=1 Tax=Rosa rugosa TaxID=74645 RepID=UPI002B40EB89|nr:uncharacterized protein LOC133734323 [Rosa rugosa]